MVPHLETLVLIYTPKEAHSRIFVTRGSVIAWQMLSKKEILARRACTYVNVLHVCKSWPPQNTILGGRAFVARILTPGSRKSGYGLLLGCWSELDAGPSEKTFFWRFWSPKTGKIFTICFGPPSQSIGHGRLSREGGREPLMFARVENGVTKSCQNNFRRKNR